MSLNWALMLLNSIMSLLDSRLIDEPRRFRDLRTVKRSSEHRRILREHQVGEHAFESIREQIQPFGRSYGHLSGRLGPYGVGAVAILVSRRPHLAP